jgi:hypothetical protein
MLVDCSDISGANDLHVSVERESSQKNFAHIALVIRPCFAGFLESPLVASRIKHTVRKALRSLACTLSTGYILFAFSERLFWTVSKEGDSLADLAITWLAYSAIAYLFLATAFWARAGDFWSMFLAGAVYGWLVEGGLIDTLYGTQPSAPFPVSISITGLSWHALISVMVGWWATGRALIASRPSGLIWISLAVGVFWGVWAMFPRRETPPIITPVPEFFLNAAILTLGLMAAWWLSFRASIRDFRPRWFGLAICTLLVALFYVQQVQTLGVLPLVVLPSLLSVALAMLYRHRQRIGRPVQAFAGDFRPSRLMILGLIPIAATIVYAIAAAAGLDRFPVSTIVYYYLTGPTGIVLLVLAIVVILRRASVAAY